MPALILANDEVLIESAAILDYLDKNHRTEPCTPASLGRAAPPVFEDGGLGKLPLVTRLLRSAMSADGGARGYPSIGHHPTSYWDIGIPRCFARIVAPTICARR